MLGFKLRIYLFDQVWRKHKSDVTSHKEDQQMLAFEADSVSNHARLTNKFAYYCPRNFMVCGGWELRALNLTQFEIIEDEFKEECLR